MVNQEELNQEKVQNLLDHLALLAAENPRCWTVASAIAYIATIPSCTQCVEEFSAQVANKKALRLLTEDYLINTMGMTIGMALKVCHVIRSLIPVMGHTTT
ncbi:polyhomeotic-like protein 3 [Amblyomma americanum]